MEWENRPLHSSTGGIKYRAYKLKQHYNYYFNVIKVPKYRQAMVKLITKSNNIPVVSGEWQRQRPYHQSLCEECEMMGDEYHFLFLCKRLKALKSKYISRYLWTKPSMNKLVELLSSEHSKTTNNLAIFVYFWLVLKWKYHPGSSHRHRTYCIYCTISCICTQADRPMLRWNKPYIYIYIYIFTRIQCIIGSFIVLLGLLEWPNNTRHLVKIDT